MPARGQDSSARRARPVRTALAVALLVGAGCRSGSSKAAPPGRDAALAQPGPAPSHDAAPAPAPVVDAAQPPALAPCPPSAYRGDGRRIHGVIPFVFPGCPSPELDLEVAYCADCARPCGYRRVAAVDGHELPERAASAYYDDAGRLTSLSSEPLRQEFEYDVRGRLRVWHEGTSAYTLDRDDEGRITRLTRRLPPPDRDETWTFVHDGDGRVVATIDPHGGRLDLLYDAAGRQIADDDSGDRVEFRHDALGRLAFLGTASRDSLTYDGRGRLVSIASAATAARTTFRYDGDRLVSVRAVDSTGRVITTTTYDHDCAGR